MVLLLPGWDEVRHLRPGAADLGDELILAGAGGYGNPLAREPAKVAEDVRQEKLSVAYASREYGVILDAETLEVDLAATTALRQRLMAEAGSEEQAQPAELEALR